MKELFLKVGARGFGGGTLWRRQRNVACGRHLHLAVDAGRVLPPTNIGVRAGTEPAPEKSAKSQVSVAKAVRIGNKPVGIWLGLIIESVSGIQGYALISRA